MIISWFTSLYTLRQLCAMHDMDGIRYSRYHELGQRVFGEARCQGFLLMLSKGPVRAAVVTQCWLRMFICPFVPSCVH